MKIDLDEEGGVAEARLPVCAIRRIKKEGTDGLIGDFLTDQGQG